MDRSALGLHFHKRGADKTRTCWSGVRITDPGGAVDDITTIVPGGPQPATCDPWSCCIATVASKQLISDTWPMTSHPRVLICGAGVAGLTLAWHLERAGWGVEVVEQAPAPRLGGYMIDFFGPGLRVADEMGLAAQLASARYPVSALSYRDRSGRQTSKMELPEDLSYPVMSLLRGDLVQAIHDQVRALVRYATSIAFLDQHEGAVSVQLTDGGRRDVDLLVGADGVHSRVRQLILQLEVLPLRYLGHHVAAYVFTDPPLSRELTTQYYMVSEPHRMAGLYPLRGDRVAIMYLYRDEDEQLSADPVAELWNRFGDLGWVIPRCLQAAPSDGSIYYDTVTQVVLDRWGRGRVTLLGDACQAVSLFAGHGASLAMAAAKVLAEEVGAEFVEPDAALARYEQRMAAAVTETQALGRRMIEWMAPSSRLRIHARDWIARLAGLPFVERRVLRSLTPKFPDPTISAASVPAPGPPAGP